MTLQLFVGISYFRHPERSEGPASALCGLKGRIPRDTTKLLVQRVPSYSVPSAPRSDEAKLVGFIPEILRGRTLFAAIAATLLATTVSAAGMAGGCNWDVDFGDAQRCFLRQFPCIVEYFGIDQPPNFPKALTCFEHEKDWPFVVLMYLNGEGTSRDLRKAESVLVAGEKRNPYAFSAGQAAALETAIRACRQNADRPCPHLDYCKDLADATFDMEVCDAVDQVSEEAALSRTLAAVKNKPSTSDRATFDRAVIEFKAYQLAEMRRASDAVIPGTLYGLAGAGQAAFTRENFMKLLAETSASDKLRPATSEAYSVVDARLRRVYREDLAQNVKDRRGGDKEYGWVITDYKKAARASQHHWVKLRDLLAKLAASLCRDQAKGFDAAMAMKFAATKTRLAELLYNPIGPSRDQDQVSAAPQLSP